jgi:hypothetical protein
MMKHGVTSLTTGRVLTGTRQVVSLHHRNTVEDETGMTKICTMSSTAEMPASALDRSSVKKGTMTIMVPITTNLTDSVLPKGGTMQEESRLLPTT